MVAQDYYEAKLYAEAEARQGRAVTMFLHIHKSAGTSLCTFARTLYRSPKFDNCNIGVPEVNVRLAYSDQYERQRSFNSLSLVEQKSVLSNAGYQFGSIEYFGLTDGALFEVNTTPQVVYITSLRHPMDRMVSQYNFMRRSNKVFRESNMTFENYLLTIKTLKDLDSVTSAYAAKHIEFVDNLMVRQLAGRDTIYSVPPGGITAAHLSKALENLNRFSVVLLVEDMPCTSSRLSTVLGWKNVSSLSTTKQEAAKSDSKHCYLDEIGQCYGRNVMELLMSMHIWDLALYYEARKTWCNN